MFFLFLVWGLYNFYSARAFFSLFFSLIASYPNKVTVWKRLENSLGQSDNNFDWFLFLYSIFFNLFFIGLLLLLFADEEEFVLVGRFVLIFLLPACFLINFYYLTQLFEYKEYITSKALFNKNKKILIVAFWLCSVFFSAASFVMIFLD